MFLEFRRFACKDVRKNCGSHGGGYHYNLRLGPSARRCSGHYRIVGFQGGENHRGEGWTLRPCLMHLCYLMYCFGLKIPGSGGMNRKGHSHGERRCFRQEFVAKYRHGARDEPSSRFDSLIGRVGVEDVLHRLGSIVHAVVARRESMKVRLCNLESINSSSRWRCLQHVVLKCWQP